MRCLVCWLILSVVGVLLLVPHCNQQLIINVRNQGGEVLQETISANVSDDIISLEFQRSDGTLVTQLIDFRNEVQIMRSLILGEEERGQSQYQVLCFIIHISKDAFISSDAMAKLRQKNPGTVRIPEEDLGRENYTLDYRVDVNQAGLLSPFVVDLCSEARESSYTREVDVQQWASLQGYAESTFHTMLTRFPSEPPHLADNHLDPNPSSPKDSSSSPTTHTGANLLPSCAETKTVWSECQCHLELCIGWYPCGLKYCKGASKSEKDSAKVGGANPIAGGAGREEGDGGKGAMSYRCGIKTCRKCYMFSYYVGQKQLCLWDE